MNANGATCISLPALFTSILLFWIMHLSRNDHSAGVERTDSRNTKRGKFRSEQRGKWVRQLPPFTAPTYQEACVLIALGTPTPSKHMHSHWCHPHEDDTDRHRSVYVYCICTHTHTRARRSRWHSSRVFPGMWSHCGGAGVALQSIELLSHFLKQVLACTGILDLQPSS